MQKRVEVVEPARTAGVSMFPRSSSVERLKNGLKLINRKIFKGSSAAKKSTNGVRRTYYACRQHKARIFLR